MTRNDMNSPLFDAAIRAHQSLTANFRKISRAELIFRMSNARFLLDRALRIEDGLEFPNSKPSEE